MNYTTSKDIEVLLTLLHISISKLADDLNVARSTLYRIKENKVTPNNSFYEKFYSYAYNNSNRRIDFNKLKIQFAVDQYDKVLFHGARKTINGEIDLNHSREDVDIGKGFYLGEGYEQASSYIFAFRNSSIYIFDVNKLINLKTKELNVSLEWMLIVCYYRKQIEEYKNTKIIKQLINDLEQYDVIIAPIADNNMYDIMTQFANGDITDEQAKSALSASNLGKQHVLKSEKACKAIKMIDHLYISEPERKDIEQKRFSDALLASDKAKLSIKNYRRVGKYIEEILK